MIITFCGHSDFCGSAEHERKILEILEENVGNARADIYLGGYGGFDYFALECCRKYKKTNPNIKLIFVTPYLDGRRLEYDKKLYDEIVYPEIENAPPRFAISYRNKYMVERADIVVAGVRHAYGGVYATYKYAKRKGKTTLNLFAFKE